MKAYVIADNKLAMNADWDNELLKIELEELNSLDFDIKLTGFDKNELDAIDLNFSDDDVEYMRDINESVNFIVKCQNISELNELKKVLGVNSNKISAEEMIGIMQ